MKALGWWVVGVVLFLGVGGRTEVLNKEALRRTKPSAFEVANERFVLGNGLTVVLSPDPTAPVAVVDLTFRAGTLYEPPKRSGLAHLIEHLMASGLGGPTDYQRLLEEHGCADFNAWTTFDLLSFHSTMPAAELPLALWVNADRLASRLAVIDAPELERQRRVVLQEHTVRVEEVPYAQAQQALFGVLYPAPHPLHGSTVGVAEELAAVTVEDVRAFVERYLVPANAVLVVTGRFEPKAARAAIEQTLGTLAPGVAAVAPAQDLSPAPRVVTAPEPRARRPRTVFAWRLAPLEVTAAEVFDFGAFLVLASTDGALGMRVDVDFLPYEGGSLFLFGVTLDHEANKTQAYDHAEALLRYLTRAAAYDDDFGAALLMRDRISLRKVDGPLERASLLTDVALHWPEASLAEVLGGHWRLVPQDVPNTARPLLKSGRFVLQSRPLNPRPERAPRE